MRFANVLHLYRVRLRARALQECFALIGIAAGVGLLFASQIASSSLSSSVGQLNSGIVGAATLQLTAREAQGMPEKLVSETRRLSGVRIAAPLLEVSANAVGPKGSDSVELVGADGTLAELKGALVRKVALTPFAGVEAVVLPTPVANTLGAKKFGDIIKFQALGHTSEAALYSKLGEKQIGALISSPIAISTLEYVQKASGLNGRVSRILVEPKPGQAASVRAGLEHIAQGRYGVESASYDEQLFAKAAAATNQSTQLFAVISALVGFLFAFNAMLLTVPQRRRLIADLRRDGYTPKAVIAVLMFDAVVLGTIACAIGLVLGDELSIHLFHSNPGYLSSAFAVGSERVVNLQSIVISVVGGMGAASVAVLSPFKDIVSRNPLAAIETKEGTGGSTSPLLTAFGLLCLAATLAILLAAPQAAIVGMVTLIAALLALLAIPLTRHARAGEAHRAEHRQRRAAHSRDGAACRALARDRDRRDRRDRRVRQRLDPRGTQRPAERAVQRGKRCQRLDRRVGIGSRQLQPVDDLSFYPDPAGQVGRAAWGALSTHLPRGPARLQRPAHLGDRAAERSLAAGTADATRRR